MIQVYPDQESLSRAAAQLVVEQAGQAVKARGRFTVALSGGRTPRRPYEILGQPPCRHQVAWDKVHIFWGDERRVPADDPRSNARLARQAWLEHVPIPLDQIHAIPGHLPPEAAAQAYEARLRAFFAGQPPSFDLVLLGLGEDGHTASLFPHHKVLKEKVRWVCEVYLAPAEPPRVTLTPVILNQAAVLAFMVAGAAKARVLQEVVQGRPDPERLPAQLIQPEGGRLLWLVDQEAAAHLAREEAIMSFAPQRT
jgi:6-phosphogluconolactonase